MIIRRIRYAVRSCDIMQHRLQLVHWRDASSWRADTANRVDVRYHMKSQNRTVSLNEYRGCNHFFSQGSIRERERCRFLETMASEAWGTLVHQFGWTNEAFLSFCRNVMKLSEVGLWCWYQQRWEDHIVMLTLRVLKVKTPLTTEIQLTKWRSCLLKVLPIKKMFLFQEGF